MAEIDSTDLVLEDLGRVNSPVSRRAVEIFESRNGFEFTVDYDGSREWDDALDRAAAEATWIVEPARRDPIPFDPSAPTPSAPSRVFVVAGDIGAGLSAGLRSLDVSGERTGEVSDV